MNRFRVHVEVLPPEQSHPLKKNWAERQLQRRAEAQQKKDANIFPVTEVPWQSCRESGNNPWFGSAHFFTPF